MVNGYLLVHSLACVCVYFFLGGGGGGGGGNKGLSSGLLVGFV